MKYAGDIVWCLYSRCRHAPYLRQCLGRQGAEKESSARVKKTVTLFRKASRAVRYEVYGITQNATNYQWMT